jgi:hypothetical protein
MYPKIKFKQQCLKDDIKLLLSSKNVIESFGTFTPMLLLFSNNIQNIYRVSYQDSSYLSNVNTHIFDYQDYKNLMKPWQNTKEQNELLLTYGK